MILTERYWDYNQVITDSRSLSVIPRPRPEVPEWSVFPARTHVVIERQGAGFRHSYRVLVENPTDSIVQFDFIGSPLYSLVLNKIGGSSMNIHVFVDSNNVVSITPATESSSSAQSAARGENFVELN